MKNKSVDTQKIVMIGAGNVAYHLGLALKQKGFNVCQVYSRTMEAAAELSALLGAEAITSIDAVCRDADMYLFAVSDSVLADLVQRVAGRTDALYVHTSGSVPMEVFQGVKAAYGVCYPLQTFTKGIPLDFSKVPLMIEGNEEATTAQLVDFAKCLSEQVYRVNSEQRQKLHLAAVLVNNFTNHLYELAGDFLQASNLSPEVLRPLIQETTAKAMRIAPHRAQTGPARRNDVNILNKHRTLLSDNPVLLNMYNLFTASILSSFEKEGRGRGISGTEAIKKN